MKGKVLKGKLLVKQDAAEEVTKGGIIIPDANQEKPNQGEVIVVGEDNDGQVKVGDKVLFADHAGTTLSLDEKELSLKGDYVLLNQQQVYLIKTED